MTNQTPESVIVEVIEYHADTIGSHWDGCYKHHAVCLAVKLRDMLREPGVPDAATESLRREAAVLELRNRYGQSNGTQTWIEFQGDPHFIVNQVLAALDGAPVIDEAAAGVAPQAPSGPTMTRFHASYPGMPELLHTYCAEHPEWGSCGEEVQARRDIAEHLAKEHAAPVQPSSTVDEATLIREAKAEAWDEGYWQGINGHTGPGNPYRDCGAAEYREGSET